MISNSLFKDHSAYTKKTQRKGTVCHMAALAKIPKKENGPSTSVAMTMTIFTESHSAVKKHII